VELDEFLAQHHITVHPVADFPGLAVGVLFPAGWETSDDSGWMRVWTWADDPHRDLFCASAVLTTHRLDAHVQAGEMFAILCEHQRHSVPNAREAHREFAAATEGPGEAGLLALEIDQVEGTLDSLTHTRIITTDDELLIAQLTVTALHDSRPDWSHIRLVVKLDQETAPTDSLPR
jgi:hypothetical protein